MQLPAPYKQPNLGYDRPSLLTKITSLAY